MTFFMYYGLDSCCNDCDYHDASIVDTVHIYFAADIPQVGTIFDKNEGCSSISYCYAFDLGNLLVSYLGCGFTFLQYIYRM
jgi:hypothetical protein